MSEGELPPATPPGEDIPESVHVTSYPKIIFLWPTWVLAFILWLIATVGRIDLGDGLSNPGYYWVGWLWIGVFTFNIFVVAFEFSSAKFFLVILVIAGILIGISMVPNLGFPDLFMPNNFYLAYTAIFTTVFFFLWLSRRFNYLEVTTQQISYHVGLMSDERRYPAPTVHFEKRTTDIFERIMPPFCAKLIMKQEGGVEAEVLNCVPRINKRLEQIKKILEHIRVKTY